MTARHVAEVLPVLDEVTIAALTDPDYAEDPEEVHE